MADFYKKSIDEVTEEFDANTSEGLSDDERQKRLDEYGPNELAEQEDKSVWEILLDNLNNIIVYLLGFAIILSLIMGDWIEAIAIGIAVGISVLTGFFAEYRAQESVNALQSMVEVKANILQNGDTVEIDSSELVPGDILVLEEGDAVGADARLISVNNLAAMESALTGESEAVDKDADAQYDDDEALGDQLNMVFSGTAITRGKGHAIVTATGMDTEVGKISDMLEGDEDSETPLDKEINQLAKALIAVAFVAAALVFILGIFNGQALPEMLQIAVILAVAAIPEAMPAVEAIVLSNGMNTMAEKQALVKTLPAVETLGSTSVIATDKTGTLTENQMTVERVVLSNGDVFKITGSGYTPEGDISIDDEEIDLHYDESLSLNEAGQDYKGLAGFIRDGFVSSNAELVTEEDEDSGEERYSITGDPTDGALTVLGHKIGLTEELLEENDYSLVEEIPFDSDRKYMANLYSDPKEDSHIIVKGAPDVIMDLAQAEGEEKEFWENKNTELADQGNRVIALGRVDVTNEDFDQIKGNLEEWINDHPDDFQMDGLFGIVDPPRKDVAESIRLTQDAGINIKMITGDHPRTASNIADQIGIANADKTITGKELDELYESDSEEFARRMQETAIFARVSPENKRQIVDSLQEQGEIVAMTGDGVNDAPALSGADIGVAMGIRGTEVAKESADMILTDDRFGTIVDAVREGRIIFENIKKYVSFLFACNMVEIVAILSTILFQLPMPLQPLHILFLNLVIDIGPAIALAFEPAESDVMEKEPRDPESGLVNRRFLTRIIISGIVIGLAAFVIFYIFHEVLGTELLYAQTATFTFMAVAQLMHIFNVRKLEGFGLDKTFLDNKVLVGAMIISVALQLFVIYTPFMQNIIGTTALDLTAWGIIIGVAIVATILVYGLKRVMGLKGD